jgi:hypothetical protein
MMQPYQRKAAERIIEAAFKYFSTRMWPKGIPLSANADIFQLAGKSDPMQHKNTNMATWTLMNMMVNDPGGYEGHVFKNKEFGYIYCYHMNVQVPHSMIKYPTAHRDYQTGMIAVTNAFIAAGLI